MTTTICPKCGSNNITYHREQTASFGGSIHSLGGGKSGHSFLYWITIGFWWRPLKWLLKLMLALCTCGLSLLFTRKKKNKISGKTVTATKTINHTVSVCQNCGHSWNA